MAATIKFGKWIPQLEAKLQQLDLETLALDSGFRRRSARKASTYPFLLGFLVAVSANASSLMAIAFSIGQQIEACFSKKAVHKRFHQGFITLLEGVLACLLSQRVSPVDKDTQVSYLQTFKRVLINDSTTLALPSKFANFFPGPVNSKKKRQATMKLQVFYDALHERFIRIDLTSFRDNDQKAAPDILSVAEKNDLVLRDLGYFTLESLKSMVQQSIFFASRLKHGVQIFKEDEKIPFDLAKHLSYYQQLDCSVKLGKHAKIPLRLIAIPVSQEVAARRRHKAKNNRDRRLNPSKEHLFLLGFNLFITNVTPDIWSAQDVIKAYQIRWRIEIIFKSWKSHFELTQLHTQSLIAIKASVYARLILITIFHQYCFAPLYYQLYAQTKTPISLLKVAVLIRVAQRYVDGQPGELTNKDALLWQQMAYHAAYEKRNDQKMYSKLIFR